MREAGDAAAALSVIRDAPPELVVLDWMLPGMSGIDLARRLRSDPRTRTTPIILLTARSAEGDRIAGLDSGADDYVTKPFSPRELTARVRAVLRRRLPQTDEAPIEFGPLRLDPGSHRVSVRGEAIALRPTEFRLLRDLMSHAPRVRTRAQLLDGVWGNEMLVDERTVDVHIRRLRAALEPGGCDALIETVRGTGYRLCAAE